jgi:periplasmic divalent cation tolerance protein
LAELFVYVTTASPEEASRIGRLCVAERLAACANIIKGMESIYQWKGEVRSDAETALILKTVEARLPALTERIRGLHSYECPCVVTLPITGGFAPYLAWIANETAASG